MLNVVKSLVNFLADVFGILFSDTIPAACFQSVGRKEIVVLTENVFS